MYAIYLHLHVGQHVCVSACFQMICATVIYRAEYFLYLLSSLFPVRHGKHVGCFRYLYVGDYFSQFL